MGMTIIMVAWFMQVTGIGIKDSEHKKVWILIGIGMMLISMGSKYLFGG